MATQDEQIEEKKEEIRDWVEGYAKEMDFELNPVQKQCETVLTGLARNQVRFGEPYCPCRLRSGDPEKDREIICPCVYHEDEIKNEGHCHCNLFFSEDGARRKEERART